MIVLVRNMDFEDEIVRFMDSEHQWRLDWNSGPIGLLKIGSKRCFAWQSCSSQLSVIKRSAFSIKQKRYAD